MSTLEKGNLLLCDYEKDSIAEDDSANLIETIKFLDDLEKAEVFEGKLLQKCFRAIHSRQALKYATDDLLSARTFNIFHETLMTKRLSFPLKTSLLTHLQKITKKNHNLVLKPISWRALWQDALDVACRSKKDQSVASEATIVAYMTKLVEFLHGSRHYLIASKAEADALIAESMDIMRDVRQVFCVDGLLMMLNILPTNYTGYAEVLPQWISVWCSISNNAQWDMCWLTLLTRARKYTKNFDWKKLMPLFSMKVRELLGLPTGARDSSAQNHDSFCFPQYYGKLRPAQVEPKKVALNKLAKLMYFTTICDPIIESTVFVRTDPLTITPPKTNASDLQNIPGYNCASDVLPIVSDIVLFFQSIRTFFYAANSGSWTQPLAYFITSFVGELGRHVGRSVACSLLGPLEKNGQSKYEAFERTMHMPTVKFLGGVLTVISVEGLYSKNIVMSQHFASNLKNLCAVDPSLGHIVMPFLLDALDPSAVNQTHQAPVALHAISAVFKPLLYPSPTILQYLPQVLTLALPGIDTCDSMKTIVTLKLFSTFLGWIPMKSSFSDSDSFSKDLPQTYSSLISKVKNGLDSNGHAGSIENDRKNAKLNLNAIAAGANDWIVGLLDKIFSLLDAHEEPQKGSRSAVDGGIGETIGFLCQSISPVTEPALWALVEGKILDYFKSSSPINAVKVSGKIVESLVSINPSCLIRVLKTLLGGDIVNGSCSHDKLAFRLRVAGGGLRASQGLSVEVLTVLTPYFSAEYTNHSEKSVRKATAKLIKDALKGSVSFYPRGIMPYDSRSGAVIGAPNNFEKAVFNWYVPSDSALSTGATILRTVAVKIMADIVSLLGDLKSSGVEKEKDKDAALSLKKAEETIAFGLKVIQKCLRGAAEVLGDEQNTGALLKFPAVVASSRIETSTAMDVDIPLSDDVDDAGEDEVDGVQLVIHTARDKALSQMTKKADRDLYATLRFTVLEFLLFCNDSLQSLSSTSISGSASVALNDSHSIQGAWAKTFRVVVNSRMACLKAVDQVKTWFTATKRMGRSVIVRAMLKAIRTRDAPSSTAAAAVSGGNKSLTELDYWRGHDMTTNEVANTGWLQHALRQKQYSTQVNKRSLTEPSKGPLLLSLMQKLNDLCGHEYSVIHLKSLVAFVHIVPRFGKKALISVKPLFKTLSLPGTTYAAASGALSILAQDVSMKRITQNWGSTEAFLRMVVLCPDMIEKVVEQDKRQILMTKLTNLFVKYVEHWHHYPLSQETSDIEGRAALFQLLLRTVGFDSKGQLVDALQLSPSPSPVPSGLLSDEGNVTLRSSSLRHQLFISFIIMHFIGHNDMEIPLGVAAWSFQTTCLAHGQPTQSVAISSLLRISYILCKGISPCLLVGAAPSSSPFVLSSAALDTISYLRTTLSSSTSATTSSTTSASSWLPFLLGVSQSHPKGMDDGSSSQWSLGIDHVLRCTEYMTSLFPRKMSSSRTDNALFSVHFRLNHAGLFLTLSSLLTSKTHPSQSSTAANPLQLVNVALNASKALESTSEEESRANNSTRAELFAGLLRGFLCLYNEQIKALPSTATAEIAAIEKLSVEVEQVLVTYFSEQVEKLSSDYFSDWAEAVYFVFSSGLCKLTNPLCCVTLDGFRRVLKVSKPSATAGAAACLINAAGEVIDKMGEIEVARDNGEEGFAGMGKALTLTRAAMTGEINACALRNAPAGSPLSSSPLCALLAHILSEQESNFFSPFRNCRLEIGKIFSLLSESGCSDSLDLSAILSKIANAVNAGAGIPADDDISQNVANVVIGELVSIASSLSPFTADKDKSSGVAVSSATVAASKSAIETACAWAQFMSQTLPSWRSTDCLPKRAGGQGFGGLLSIVLCGSGHADFELAKLSHEVCIRSLQGIRGDMRAGGVRVAGDILSIAVDVIVSHKDHPSFHVRETVMLCGFVLTAKNSYCLSESELKALKNLFVDGLHDVKPEVANLAKAGVISYLALKTPKDLKSLSETYIKNSDVLASREFKKRKLDKGNSSTVATCKPDKMHMTTVLMMSCVIQALPYDLPPFLPSLLISLARHVTFGPLKETVTKTIQSFKGSHQDRWESDFKAGFTREQLEDLEGAGSAHYFS